MEDLPAEIKIKISSFLPSKDVAFFATTNKQMYQDIDIAMLISEGDQIGMEKKKSWSGKTVDDRAFFWTSIPLVLEEKTHSVTFSCTWRDQGWGNQKGHLFITSRDASNQAHIELIPMRRSLSDGNQHVVARSNEVCGHGESVLQLSFTPQSNKIYELWREVGGGGGHELFLTNIQIKQVVHGRRHVDLYDYLSFHGFLTDTIGNRLVWKGFKAMAEYEMDRIDNDEPDDRFTALLQSLGVVSGDKESLAILRSCFISLQEGDFFPYIIKHERDPYDHDYSPSYDSDMSEVDY